MHSKYKCFAEKRYQPPFIKVKLGKEELVAVRDDSYYSLYTLYRGAKFVDGMRLFKLTNPNYRVPFKSTLPNPGRSLGHKRLRHSDNNGIRPFSIKRRCMEGFSHLDGRKLKVISLDGSGSLSIQELSELRPELAAAMNRKSHHYWLWLTETMKRFGA